MLTSLNIVIVEGVFGIKLFCQINANPGFGIIVF